MNTEIFTLSHTIAQRIIGKSNQLNQQYRSVESNISGEISSFREKKAALVSQKGHAVARKKSLKIVGFFYKTLEDEILGYFSANGHQAKIFENIEDLKKHNEQYDIFFTVSNFVSSQEFLSQVIEYTINYGGNGISCIWLWDHHHVIGGSLSMATYFDIVFPIHETAADYLKVTNSHVMNSIPAATYQFGPTYDTERFYRTAGGAARSDGLYGGFREYPNMDRNTIIKECMEKIPGNSLYFCNPNNQNDQYYSLQTAEDRFLHWMRHKVSLSVSINTDIPIRIFDALCSGQIPLVCSNLNGFDHIISPEDQIALPIIRFPHYDVQEIRRAYETALEYFDRDGAEGAYRRHTYAIRHHMMLKRVARMVTTIRLHFR